MPYIPDCGCEGCERAYGNGEPPQEGNPVGLPITPREPLMPRRGEPLDDAFRVQLLVPEDSSPSYPSNHPDPDPDPDPDPLYGYEGNCRHCYLGGPLNHHRVCRRCAYLIQSCLVCEDMHRPYDPGDGTWRDSGGSGNPRFCVHCEEDGPQRCEWCDDWFIDIDEHNCSGDDRECPDDYDDGDHDDDGEEHPCRCPAHSTDRNGSGSLINYYSYRPEPLSFRGDGPRFLGMELEIECGRADGGRSRQARYVHEIAGEFVYLKEDGSIVDGFEMVTHPMSHPYFLTHFPWGMLRELRHAGCHTTSNNGLHVHVSRDAFTSPSHLFRWMKLWYRSEREITALARRDPSLWGGFHLSDRRAQKWYAKGAPRGLNARDRTEYRAVCGPYHSPGRGAINVSNPETIEVRVFRSTLSPRKARAALALVDASVEYTRTLTSADVCKKAGWQFTRFRKWVHGRPQYSDLSREMEARL